MLIANCTLARRFSRGASILVVVFCMLFAGATANAACHMPGLRPVKATQLPAPSPNASNNGSIVGVWHVFYTDSNGNPFFESLDTWHADGTEFEIANGFAAEGNLCVGVWKKVGPNSVQLNHIGWNFNPDGSPAGYFTLTETNTVDSGGNSYRGTFDFKLFDSDGNLLSEVTGTMVASRITV